MDNRILISINSKDLDSNNVYTLDNSLSFANKNERILLESFSMKNDIYQIVTGYNAQFTVIDDNAGTPEALTVTLTNGTYTHAELAAEIDTQLTALQNSTPANVFSAVAVSYDANTDRITINCTARAGTVAVLAIDNANLDDPHFPCLIGFAKTTYSFSDSGTSHTGTMPVEITSLGEVFLSVKFEDDELSNLKTSELKKKQASFSFPVGQSTSFGSYYTYKPDTKYSLTIKPKTQSVLNIQCEVRNRYQVLSDALYQLVLAIGTKEI